MSKRIYKGLTAVVLCALLLVTQVIGIMPTAQNAQAAPGDYYSPFDVAYSPDGTKIAASDSTKAKVHIINASTGTVTYSVTLNGTPKCVAWKDSTSVYVAEYDARTIAVVNSTNGTVSSRFNVGPKPFGLAYVSSTSKLYVTDFGLHDVRVVDVTTGNTTATIALPDNYPNYITVTPNNSYAIVGYQTPTGNATSTTYASRVSFLLLSNNTVSSTVALPQGSTNLRAIKCSPNGSWAYVAHMYGRMTLPTTQLTKGWVYTNAISVFQLSDRTYYTTFLLDRISEGFANPWGLAVSSDNNTLWVSSSGCHQLAKIDMGLLNQLMAGTIPSAYIQSGANLNLPDPLNRKKSRYTRPFSDTWFYIKQSAANRTRLKNDLSALWGAGVMSVIQLEADASPRGIALSPDGTKLAVAGFLTGKIYTVNTSTKAIAQTIAVGTQPSDDSARAGYKLYVTAIDTQQHWLGCGSCHPDARPDGLNWDLLNDGIGNPKNAKSHLNAHMTAPSMAHGIRRDYTVAIDAGYKFLKFVIPTQDKKDKVAAHMQSQVAESDPFRNADGTMTSDALAGKALFDTYCVSCHSGPLFTDYQLHTTTYTDPLDSNQSYDTPSLIEIWRTAPYLHNGSAATLLDAINALGYGSAMNTTQKNQVVAYMQQIGASTASLGNQAPKVTAGYDWTINLPTTQYNIVSAACTDDHLPSPPDALTYTWSKVSGPSVTWDNVNLLNPTVTFTGGVGTYVLQLSASDSSLNASDTCTITVVNATATPTATATPSPTPTPATTRIPHSGMTATATSQHTGNEASKTIDNNTSTFWHSEWGPPISFLPQSVTINLAGSYNVGKVTYLPRQDAGMNGTITYFKVYTSTNGIDFTLRSTGAWAWDSCMCEKYVCFPAVTASYVKLESIAGYGLWSSAAEINVEQISAGLPTPTPTPTPSTNRAFISDLAETYSSNGWGPIEKDMSNGENGAGDGTTITLNGVTYAKGIGAHAASEVRYNLTGTNFTRFVSDVGVDDEKSASSTIVFQVWGDSTKIYDSGTMTPTTATKTVDVNVSGYSTLKLIITDAGDGNNSDHGDWAGAQLLKSSFPPTPWILMDIGAPAIAGTASYSSGTYTVAAGGTDIYGTADQFSYVYQAGNGDGSISARVVSEGNTDPWAKAGVMYRDTINAGSMQVDLIVTPSNGLNLQYRSATGGSSSSVSLGAITLPAYIKLTRTGNTFNAYKSTDGINWGSSLGSCSVTMAATPKMGLCVTSHNVSAASTVVYDSVSVTP